MYHVRCISLNVRSFQRIGDPSNAGSVPNKDNASAPDQLSNVTVASSNPVPFALSPALVSNAIINYRTASGSKLFKGATATLLTLFNREPQHLQLFRAQL